MKSGRGYLWNLAMILLVVGLVSSSATAFLLGVGDVPGAQASEERTTSILATGNPPTFKVTPTDPQPGDYGVPISFTIVVNDTDNDNINVTWDWGDGTFSTNFTPPAKVLQIVKQDHAYYPSPYGEWTSQNYTLNITLDDGNGNLVWDLTTVSVTRPINRGPTIWEFKSQTTGLKLRVNPGDDVLIVSNATDPEGDSLNWTYTISDPLGPIDTFTIHTDASAPGEAVWSNFTYAFAAAENYTILLQLSDAPAPYDVFPHNVSEDIIVEVVENAAPDTASRIVFDPANPVVESGVGYVLVNFTIEAADMDGDALTATWDFDDGTEPVVQTSPGGIATLYPFTVWRNYTDAGFFNVSVTVTDGIPGHEITLTAFVQVNSTNLPPILLELPFHSHGPHVFVGEDVEFEAVLTDPEQDPIELTWIFDDSTPAIYCNLTEYDDGNVSCNLRHTFDTPGNHTLTLLYTDNKIGLFNHLKNASLNISVVVDDTPPVPVPGENQTVMGPATVSFNGSGSFDNWEIVNYTWSFTYNGTPVILWGPTPDFYFWTPGLYEVLLNVTDPAGNYNTTTTTVDVAEPIPEFSMLTPVVMMIVISIGLSLRRMESRKRSKGRNES